ncbi:hypothetical protein SmJEL517_g01236 [Synchytrium microbalum]|uniref:Uncharacterized protein n=1 Tax=Synchytrium microbalum TaxID=1806994 RepID=A0A507CEW6_9FUNG|nr:uncharacterized protein SmJEL517_g01236 [Synchytrium microbalum]TPX36566.1 hypothetical protein SmJEL517_g01236 [Synchytrium microbalum]
MSLFGTPAQAPSKHLLEIKAGKLIKENNMLKPDVALKGLLYLEQEDDLMHVIFQDRTTKVIVEDLILFPGDAELVKIHARNYVLKWKEISQRVFFWMQEPKEETDAELVAKFNNIINNQSVDVNEDAQIQALLSQTSGGTSSRSAATTAPASGAAPSSKSAQMDQLRSILANIQVPPSEPDLDLSDAITPDLVSGMLSDSHVAQALFPHLPAGAKHTTAELNSVIRSPQFKSALRTLSYAIRSQQLTAAQLGVEGGSNQPLQSVLQLLKIMQERYGSSMQTD